MKPCYKQGCQSRQTRTVHESVEDQADEAMDDRSDDVMSAMQKFDASIPFGSKLSQLQGHLNGFDHTQCNQVACHLRVMVQRLRQLAGAVPNQVADRFQRLEALVASYYTEDVEVPLDLQIWSESQLRVLIPYLNGGRTPESEGTGTTAKERPAVTEASTSGAASSTEMVLIEDSVEAMESEGPEYRVCRVPGGPWEAATPEEEAEFRARDRAIESERRAQEEADRLAFNQHEASIAQRWDDWAVSSELERSVQPPSRKKVRITICAGTGSGQQIGETCLEGVIAHDQQATVTFTVVETLLGGLASTVDAAAAQADPQLADFDRDHLPGLPELVQEFMATLEGRHWLWQFQHGLVTLETVQDRYGAQIAEAFQLWVAMQADTEKEVKNAGDELLEVEAASSSTSSTIAVERPSMAEDTGPGPAAAGIFIDMTGMGAEMAMAADTLPDGEDSLLRAELSEILGSDFGEPVASVDGASMAPATGQAQSADNGCVEEGEGDREVSGDAMDVQLEGHDQGPLMEQEANERGLPAEPYEIPQEWARTMRSWNDPAIGAGLPNSTGEFEHAGEGCDDAAGQGEPEQAASCTPSGSGTSRATESAGGHKQTDLKSWLK